MLYRFYPALLISLCFVSASVNAGPIFYGGLSFGGDSIAEYEDGSTALRAGDLFQVSAGYQVDASDNLKLEALIGYKIAIATDSENDSVSFTRFPIEIGPKFNFKEVHNIGLGVSHHLKVKRSTDVPGQVDRDFKDSTGAYIYYSYQLEENLSVGIRFTNIEYEIKNYYDDVTIDGSNTALFVKSSF